MRVCNYFCSVASLLESLGNSKNLHLTKANILALAVAHGNVSTPNANEQGLAGERASGTTTALSGESAELDAILFVGTDEHVLLVANTEAAFLGLAVASAAFHESSMLVASDFFSGSITLVHVEFVCGKLEALRASPNSTIMAVNASELVAVSK